MSISRQPVIAALPTCCAPECPVQRGGGATVRLWPLAAAEQVAWLAQSEPVQQMLTLRPAGGMGVEGPAIMCRAADIAVPEGKALEREANAFAATLLMPQGPVRDAFRSAAPGDDSRFGVKIAHHTISTQLITRFGMPAPPVASR